MVRVAWKRIGLAALAGATTVFVLTRCGSVGQVPLQPPVSGELQTGTAELLDSARSRTIPIRIRALASIGKAPIVVLSHGMGESRETSDWLAEEWAGRGYFVVSLTHAGSDRTVLEEQGILGIIAATKDPETWRNRPLDVTVVLDAIERRDPAVPMVERADMNRVAVAGHSAGAFTAAALAGLPEGDIARLADRRVDAIIAMSMPKLGEVVPAHAWSRIDVPALHVTGTLDFSIQYLTFPRHRRVPWENAAARGDQYLVTLCGATHSTYSNPEPESDGRGRRLHRAVRGITSLFLDAYLRGDGNAAERLAALERIDGIRIERK